MPTYTRTQTVQALRWTDDLSANDVVQWINRQGGRAFPLSTDGVHLDQVRVVNKSMGRVAMKQGDWVIESKLPAGTRPHDPITAFVTCDPETFTREGWTPKDLPSPPEPRCRSCHGTKSDHVGGAGSGPGCTGYLPPDGQKESEQLRTLIKLLCSDVSPYGSEAFQRVRDQVNPETQALLLSVLDAAPQPKPVENHLRMICENCGTNHGSVTAGEWYRIPFDCCSNPRPALRRGDDHDDDDHEEKLDVRVLSEMKRAERAEARLRRIAKIAQQVHETRRATSPNEEIDRLRMIINSIIIVEGATDDDDDDDEVSDATLETMAAGGYAVPLFPQPDGTVKVGRSPETVDALAERVLSEMKRAELAEERLERIKRIFRDE
jgi:hypothetical protein